MGRSNIIPFRPLRRVPRDPFGGNWFEAYRRFWNLSLNRLTDYLTIMQKENIMDDLKIVASAGQPTVIMTRTLNAPRALVWKALSEAQHVVRWWGPHGLKNEVLQFDWKVGGKWRIKTINSQGETIVFFGEYLEIEPIEKVTQTFSFDQLPEGAHSVDTVILEDHGDKTVYRALSTLPDVASRDGMLATGMDKGVREGFERLDQMLEDWKALA
jgi:uncharacterized protein YndB with AHSA1/START domain